MRVVKTKDEVDMFLSPVGIFRQMSKTLLTVPKLESELEDERSTKAIYIKDNLILEVKVSKYIEERKDYSAKLKQRQDIINDQKELIIELESGNKFRYLIGVTVGMLGTVLIYEIILN